MAYMTHRERLLTALNHKNPDRVPLDLGSARACKLTKQFYLNLLDALGMSQLKETVRISNPMSQAICVDDIVLEKLGCDVAEPFIEWEIDPRNPAAATWEDSDNFYLKTNFGIVYRMPKSQMLYYDMYEFPLSENEYEEEDANYRFPYPVAPAKSTIDGVRKYKDAGYATVFSRTYGDGLLTQGYSVYGMEKWMIILATEQNRAHSFLERFLDAKLEYWNKVLTALGDSVDVVCESDDFGTQNSTIISYDMFKTMIFPYFKKLIQFIRSKTKAKILMHSCGSIYSLIPDFIDAGVDILNPVQFTANNMNLNTLKSEYGRDLTFWGGGIDTQYVLGSGKVAEVKDMVKRNLDIMKKDGGFVFATVHNIQANVPVENFIAMWEAFQENCHY